MTTYETPGCAYCPSTVRAFRRGEDDERGPGLCPSKVDAEGIVGVDAYRRDPFSERVAQVCSAEGYCKWTRVEEICESAKPKGFKRAGIAHCIIFVASCLVDLALKEEKIRPGTLDPICNPTSQPELLNRAGCELNVFAGHCRPLRWSPHSVHLSNVSPFPSGRG